VPVARATLNPNRPVHELSSMIGPTSANWWNTSAVRDRSQVTRMRAQATLRPDI